ncbi:MAG: hypothetical protein O4861_05310 [Trichodesmium sp. St16_bin4-tuft]|nr:hypothetical protein [Trichodesmium sp. St5_bin8]MDE5079313.1 hypothetical protein [Trichodesmium sp. St2_bin6]MDE5097784.1 hypothetical protein [Trichodesmium sp. St16_bin4-tuft]MDE5105146.1 hypothetical protein [Trichodesmium sp. St19_bin2]
MKKAKFVILYAPLLVRLKRLLIQNNALDKITQYSEDAVVYPQKKSEFFYFIHTWSF